nr:hypothetical protein GCM10020185_15350 [Pseudomonas brassicacearum subsp. brassicacearum]
MGRVLPVRRATTATGAGKKILRELAVQVSGLSLWLFEESYQAVGDLAETISLVLPESPHSSDEGLALWIEEKLLPLRGESPEILAEQLPALWAQLDRPSLMLCIKLITGSFRVGVSKLLVTRALAGMANLDSKRVAQRLVGYTDLSHRPTAASYLKLIAAESADEHAQRGGQPYPFFSWPMPCLPRWSISTPCWDRPTTGRWNGNGTASVPR